MKYIVRWIYLNESYVKGGRTPYDLIIMCFVYKAHVNGLVVKTVDKRTEQITDNKFFNFDGIRI